MKAVLFSALLLVAGCNSRPPAAPDTTGQSEASSLPTPDPLSTEAFLGLRDSESRKIGESAPESALAGITEISEVSLSDYVEYQRALASGKVKAHGKRNGYVYYAVEQALHVPFQNGSSAYVNVTKRYKAKIPNE